VIEIAVSISVLIENKDDDDSRDAYGTCYFLCMIHGSLMETWQLQWYKSYECSLSQLPDPKNSLVIICGQSSFIVNFQFYASVMLPGLGGSLTSY
jgi:hypothetical protein